MPSDKEFALWAIEACKTYEIVVSPGMKRKLYEKAELPIEENELENDILPGDAAEKLDRAIRNMLR